VHPVQLGAQVISQVERDFICAALKERVRVDGRGLDDFRKVCGWTCVCVLVWPWSPSQWPLVVLGHMLPRLPLLGLPASLRAASLRLVRPVVLCPISGHGCAATVPCCDRRGTGAHQGKPCREPGVRGGQPGHHALPGVGHG
jgi:hypothetical protein